jgi:hypothetical protein
VVLSRSFAVLAAILLITSFGLIILAPYDMPLVQGIVAIDPSMLRHLQYVVIHTMGSSVWSRVLTPIIARPVWLVPLSLGIVCVGVATTIRVPACGQRKPRQN